MVHYLMISTHEFFSVLSAYSPDLMITASTNPSHFTPKRYDDTWVRADCEKNYKNLCKEYTSLSVQLARATRPFGRERTTHNLLNARVKLEHQLKSLNKEYLAQQAKSHFNLVEHTITPPAKNYETEAELRKALQDSKDTLKDVLDGISQSQGSTAPSDRSGEVRLMNSTTQLQVEYIELLTRLTDLEKEKAQSRELLDKERARCETLETQVKFYRDMSGIT